LPPYLAPAELHNEAISALAGLIAEELFGDGDALSSVGELVGGVLYARRAAWLVGTDELEGADEALICAISLVEHNETAIRKIAELLARRKRISRWQPSVLKILDGIAQGPLVTKPLSVLGQALFDKIKSALEELAPLIVELATGEELQEAGL
jgi:hypothetical protein